MLRGQDDPEAVPPAVPPDVDGAPVTRRPGGHRRTRPSGGVGDRIPGWPDAIALLGTLGALAVMVGLQVEGRTAGAPWPVQLALGVLFLGLRADPVQRRLGGGSLPGRNGARTVLGALVGAALCLASGTPELVPALCLVVISVHLHWQARSALLGGAIACLLTSALTLAGVAGGLVDPLSGPAFPLVLLASWGLAWAALGNLGVLARQQETTQERLTLSYRQREASLRHAVRHDPLTGVLARGAIVEELETASRSARPGHAVGVLFCDLDGFNPVNDQHGHAVGDALLVEVAARLRSAVGAAGLVGRTGGDEFVVALPAVAHPTSVDAVARRVRRALEQPVGIGEVALRVGISVGTAVSERPVDVDDLLNAADARMYAVKHSGRRRRSGPGAFREAPRA